MWKLFRKLSRLRPYLKQYRRYLWWGLAALILTNALQLLAPLVLRDAINHIEQRGPVSTLTWYGLAIAGLAVLSGIFRYWVRRTIIWASRKIEFDLRGDLYSHLLKLGSSYYDKTPIGDIITRASSDIEGVRMLVGPGIMQGLNTILVVAIAVPMMAALSWKLSLYALIPFPILAYMTNRVGGVAHRRMMAIQNMFSQLSAGISESFAGIRVLKAYAMEEDRLREFHRENEEYLRLNMHLIRLWGGFWPLLATLGGLTLVIVLYFGGRAVIAGDIGLGTLIAFTIYLGMLLWPMIALGWVVSLYQRGVVSMERIGAVLDVQPDVEDAGATTLPVARATTRPPVLELRDLRFAYPGHDVTVLSGVSFRLNPGETLALVGPTASGKSTIVALLWRRYKIGPGMILLDGKDINEYSVADWRSYFAVVPQESFLFSNRIAANMLYATGSDNGDGDRAAQWGQMAALTADVQTFPKGYETIIGERGVTLSGGQKQRVSIARALAAESPLLVLDDAFSAVDAETEEEILGGLSEYLSSRSAIVIAHRISTIRRADRIAFMDQGRIVELGTHDELVSRNGRYADWVRLETIRERLEQL